MADQNVMITQRLGSMSDQGLDQVRILTIAKSIYRTETRVHTVLRIRIRDPGLGPF
jgi:hypothetical protein